MKLANSAKEADDIKFRLQKLIVNQHEVSHYGQESMDYFDAGPSNHIAQASLRSGAAAGLFKSQPCFQFLVTKVTLLRKFTAHE